MLGAPCWVDADSENHVCTARQLLLADSTSYSKQNSLPSIQEREVQSLTFSCVGDKQVGYENEVILPEGSKGSDVL